MSELVVRVRESGAMSPSPCEQACAVSDAMTAATTISGSPARPSDLLLRIVRHPRSKRGQAIAAPPRVPNISYGAPKLVRKSLTCIKKTGLDCRFGITAPKRDGDNRSHVHVMRVRSKQGTGLRIRRSDRNESHLWNDRARRRARARAVYAVDSGGPRCGQRSGGRTAWEEPHADRRREGREQGRNDSRVDGRHDLGSCRLEARTEAAGSFRRRQAAVLDRRVQRRQVPRQALRGPARAGQADQGVSDGRVPDASQLRLP